MKEIQEKGFGTKAIHGGSEKNPFGTLKTKGQWIQYFWCLNTFPDFQIDFLCNYDIEFPNTPKCFGNISPDLVCQLWYLQNLTQNWFVISNEITHQIDIPSNHLNWNYQWIWSFEQSFQLEWSIKLTIWKVDGSKIRGGVIG